MHNPAENYQMFTSDDTLITQQIDMTRRSGPGLTTKSMAIAAPGAAAGTVSFPLQDQYYRQLLLVKAAANIATCDCPSINALMRAMFGNRGRCYVGYDSAHPMHIGYHFEFFPTPVEKSIIQSGLFPQPAGTIAQFIFETLDYSPFGFAGGNTGANPKFVTGWSQGPFYQPGAAGGEMLNNIGGTFILDQSQLG